MAKSDRLFATGWVHAFEEDTAEGAVFRRDDASIPLSRRPRERLVLYRDGKATVFVQGPDDRYVEQKATWKDDGKARVVRTADGTTTIRIVKVSADRLVAEIHRTRSSD